MTNLSPDQGATGGFAALVTTAEPVLPSSWEFQPRVVRTIAIVAVLLIGISFQRSEGWLASLFIVAVTLTVGALLVLVSRRVLLAVVLAAAMVGSIHIAAYLKQQETEMLLHAYDLLSLLRSWRAVVHFCQDYPHFAIGLVCASSAIATAGWIACRLDGMRIRRGYAAVAVVICACLAGMAAAAKGERLHTEFYLGNPYVSFFFASWSETLEALWRGQVIEAAPRADGARLETPAGCAWTSRPPNIVLIHQESVVPPSHFPSLNYDRSLDPFFRSVDGQLHKLRVETYGGASWLTEFSVLTGLSTYSFGGMRQVVQPLMRGKVQDTLPQALARCGYRNVAIYPMLRRYLGAGKFFEAVGLSEIFDAKDQKAKLANERDSFYYANLIAEMQRHFKSSIQPLFAYVETMATHGPHDNTYMPEVDVPGGGPGTDAGMHEYLRRLAMAAMDYRSLRAELSKRFPGQQFLIVHYGDHQPMTTWTLLGLNEDTTVEEVMRSRDSPALITYYAVDAVRYRPSPLPAPETVDVPYLGTVILEAAGLPLSDAYRERKRLMALCDGRYFGCVERDEILKFQRRLMDSGLIEGR